VNWKVSGGGHIEPEDDPNQAAVREVKEEVGLDVELYDNRKFKYDTDGYKELIPPQFMNRHRISDTHEHVTFTFFAIARSDQLALDVTNEVSDEVGWFTKQELENLSEEELSPHVKYYALAALDACAN
jgi:8-oxo-dGTP pyrophosphatase MutT (NUDIX family)